MTPAELVLQAVPLSERTAIVLVALGDGHCARPQNQPSVYRAVLTTLKQTKKNIFLKKQQKKKRKEINSLLMAKVIKFKNKIKAFHLLFGLSGGGGVYLGEHLILSLLFLYLHSVSSTSQFLMPTQSLRMLSWGVTWGVGGVGGVGGYIGDKRLLY